ncbi:hypothetical protein AB6887_02090 [Carnobacterium divergens]|uniref:Uncharacterized protein n=2 Tax=Carnobacterium divergens TaxID=2748 RepID=A0A7Z8CZ46_CARDV|nr:hypothetical protein [Carnobacterium divergens]TFI73630.1 hypothetical protein CKN58_06570 [Carnobacterium divergens]TFI77577.1 hypothetical protein CKN85_06565 [Carnobacterium divergens]TFI84340.1 hypothetical protein CKN56_06605 [Carnobacterium divergens]TFI96187.1 hypothetical protein CKN64_06545 [Carnobacterium divergens]TFJ12490.1 hypothetical protein CKN60_06610 [Carnobacterium divergens]
MIETLCDISFEQQTFQVGNSSYSKFYLFSESDIEKFKKVAILHNKGHPLKEAILQSFSMKDFKKKTTIVQTSSLFLENLIKNTKLANEQIIDLSNQLIQLEKKLNFIAKQNYQLEKRVVIVEKSKMDKPFHKKRS